MKKTLVVLAFALIFPFTGAIAATPSVPSVLDAKPVTFFSVKLTQNGQAVANKTMSVELGHSSVADASGESAKSSCTTAPGIEPLGQAGINLPLSGNTVMVWPTDYREGVVKALVFVGTSNGTSLGEAATSGTCTIAPADSVTQSSVRLVALKKHQASSFVLPNGTHVEVRLNDVVDPTAPISEDDCSCTVKRY